MAAFPAPLIGCEMGIAYGGGVERLGQCWRGKGFVFGFDTFHGHPRELALRCPDTLADGGPLAHAAKCMDYWYADPEYGRERYGYDYIRFSLDAHGLHNVVLVQGLIGENTNIDFIPHLHYAMLDMDFPLSMRHGHRLVRDKILPGGYLCLHDVVPDGHIAGLYRFYREVVVEGLFSVVREETGSYLAVLQRL